MAHCTNCGAEMSANHICASEILQAGTMVGEYRVEKKLGEGGMGAVFAGVHPRIGKKVAIKVLNKAMASDPHIVTRFENEARAVNAIGNRNIVDIFSFGTLDEGSPYFVMEWLTGLDLDAYLRSRQAMDLHDALPILRQVCRALAAAHEKGIVHRDLKPENVFLTPEPDGSNFVKLLDFGIAKFHGDEAAETRTRAGSMMGTPHFMSPEQALGQEIDHRTDIYAMAIMVYRMVANRYPFDGPPMVIISAHLNQVPESPRSYEPSISEELDAVILKNLAKDPKDRHQSVLEFLDALEACVPEDSEPTVMPTITGTNITPAPPARWALTGKLPLILAVVAALGIGAALLVLRGGDDASKGAAPAIEGSAKTVPDVAPLLELPSARGFKQGASFSEPPRSK